MPMKNPERALAAIVGEVHGLFLAIQALARTHSDPASALAVLNKAEPFGLAALEPHPIPDEAIVGYQHALEGIRQALEANPLYSPDQSA
jgi:hypothetical protein